jgi:hypothetical protein
MRFFTIYRRKKMKDPVRTLRIDGIKTTITPKPDDAELAAQALLESMAAPKVRSQSSCVPLVASEQSSSADIRPQTSAYYKDLSEKIKAAHEHDRRMATRYVAYVEEQLSTPLAHREGQGESPFATLERGLYQHQDAIEREGGELKQRWQKCLALVIVKQYKTKTNTDLTDDADEHQPSDI